MESNELAKAINKINTDIKELKFRQAIGGDSWFVYRFEKNYTALADHYYQVDFVPTSFGNFVAKAYLTDPDRTLYGSDLNLFPDPYTNGRWYITARQFSTVDRTVFIYSTKQGTISITDISI